MTPDIPRLNLDNITQTGARFGIVAVGFGDHTEEVFGPHNEAANRITEAGLSSWARPFGHARPDNEGHRLENFIGDIEDLSERNGGPIFLLSTSAAGAYTVNAASHVPDAVAGALLMAPRLRFTGTQQEEKYMEELEMSNPEYFGVVLDAHAAWRKIPGSLQSRILSVRTDGDIRVTEEAAKLPGLAYQVFPDVKKRGHQAGIGHMLSGGLQTAVNLLASQNGRA